MPSHGAQVAPEAPDVERSWFGVLVIGSRLRDPLMRLNPELAAGVLENAFRRITRPEGATLEAAADRMLGDG